jgi:hypothetical protein
MFEIQTYNTVHIIQCRHRNMNASNAQPDGNCIAAATDLGERNPEEILRP